MTKTIKLNITRSNGKTEEKEVLGQFHFMNKSLFDKIKKSTADAGAGTVNFATIVKMESNIPQMVKQYNDLHNEGGDGYIPDNDYFKNSRNYKEWEVTEIIK